MTTRLTLPITLLAFSLGGCTFQETLTSGTDNPCVTLNSGQHALIFSR